MYRKESIMVLKDEELAMINGGAVKYTVLAIVAGVVAFAVGIIDGYLRPLPCNK